jgi:hypothetical protein
MIRHLEPAFCHIKEGINAKIPSSMLCTSRIHPFSLGNYLRTSFIIGNLMITRVTSGDWTWLGYLKSKGDYDFG